MQRQLFEGDEVMLVLDPNPLTSLGITPGMRKWDGCVSEYGIPYSIVRDWIVPTRSLAAVSTVYRTGGAR